MSVLEERAFAFRQRAGEECSGDPNTCPYAEPDPGSPEAPACMAREGDPCEWHRPEFINATSVARAGKLKAGTIVRLPDGRIGTICFWWHNYHDGIGGVWGEHDLQELAARPQPHFMLRDKRLESAFRTGGRYRKDVECVGEMLKIVRQPRG